MLLRLRLKLLGTILKYRNSYSVNACIVHASEFAAGKYISTPGTQSFKRKSRIITSLFYYLRSGGIRQKWGCENSRDRPCLGTGSHLGKSWNSEKGWIGPTHKEVFTVICVLHPDFLGHRQEGPANPVGPHASVGSTAAVTVY